MLKIKLTQDAYVEGYEGAFIAFIPMTENCLHLVYKITGILQTL